jgi:Asp-tRNA(Asn)/Glu-tRNA(Gln) amidotransferase A subunit family amidase
MRSLLYAGALIPARRYVQAARARTMMIEDQLAALKGVDVLALPTVAIPAPRMGDTVASVGKRQVVDAALPGRHFRSTCPACRPFQLRARSPLQTCRSAFKL